MSVAERADVVAVGTAVGAPALVARIGLAGLLVVVVACTSVVAPDTRDAPYARSAPDASSADASSVVGVEDLARESGLETLERAVVRVEGEAGTLRFAVLVADTDTARSRGLQGVARIPDGVGMLFVFPDEPGPGGRPGFWMLDTVVPLDIAFVDAGTIVGVATMTPCAARPCPITHPGVPYDMALETAAGALVGAGIVEGDRLSLEP